MHFCAWWMPGGTPHPSPAREQDERRWRKSGSCVVGGRRRRVSSAPSSRDARRVDRLVTPRDPLRARFPCSAAAARRCARPPPDPRRVAYVWVFKRRCCLSRPAARRSRRPSSPRSPRSPSAARRPPHPRSARHPALDPRCACTRDDPRARSRPTRRPRLARRASSSTATISRSDPPVRPSSDPRVTRSSPSSPSARHPRPAGSARSRRRIRCPAAASNPTPAPRPRPPRRIGARARVTRRWPAAQRPRQPIPGAAPAASAPSFGAAPACRPILQRGARASAPRAADSRRRVSPGANRGRRTLGRAAASPQRGARRGRFPSARRPPRGSTLARTRDGRFSGDAPAASRPPRAPPRPRWFLLEPAPRGRLRGGRRFIRRVGGGAAGASTRDDRWIFVTARPPRQRRRPRRRRRQRHSGGSVSARRLRRWRRPSGRRRRPHLLRRRARRVLRGGVHRRVRRVSFGAAPAASSLAASTARSRARGRRDRSARRRPRRRRLRRHLRVGLALARRLGGGGIPPGGVVAGGSVAPASTGGGFSFGAAPSTAAATTTTAAGRGGVLNLVDFHSAAATTTAAMPRRVRPPASSRRPRRPRRLRRRDDEYHPSSTGGFSFGAAAGTSAGTSTTGTSAATAATPSLSAAATRRNLSARLSRPGRRRLSERRGDCRTAAAAVPAKPGAAARADLSASAPSQITTKVSLSAHLQALARMPTTLVPEREILAIAKAYDSNPNNPEYRFRHYFHNVVPDAARRARPPAVDELKWRGLLDEVGGEHNAEALWPVPGDGFKTLAERARVQDAELASQREYLDAVASRARDAYFAAGDSERRAGGANAGRTATPTVASDAHGGTIGGEPSRRHPDDGMREGALAARLTLGVEPRRRVRGGWTRSRRRIAPGGGRRGTSGAAGFETREGSVVGRAFAEEDDAAAGGQKTRRGGGRRRGRRGPAAGVQSNHRGQAEATRHLAEVLREDLRDLAVLRREREKAEARY